MNRRKMDKIFADTEAAIRDLRPQDALVQLKRIETAMTAHEIAPDEALRDRLARLGGLVVAVSQGIAAARLELGQMLREATTLQTYDAQGQLTAQSHRSRPVRRF